MDKARIATDQSLTNSPDVLSTNNLSTKNESTPRARRSILRPAADALVALAAFALISVSLSSQPSSANPNPAQFNVPHETVKSFALKAVSDAGNRPVVEIATTSSPANADAVYRRTSSSAAWLLLAFAFSGIVALNLAVLRHLRQAYAAPRSR